MYVAEMSWPALGNLSRSVPVVIPVAAVEQHGHHLPVGTDSLLLGEVVRRAEEQLGERALFLPQQWLGNSHHHTDFPGTISASPRLYLDLLGDLAENFLRQGFQRIFFLNGHGGNITPGKQACFELRQRYRDRKDLLFLFSSYWDLGKAGELGEGYVQQQMGHACEWETSMILRLNPNLVQGDVGRLETVPFDYGFEPAYRGWTTKDRSETGHIGSPQYATAEKGERLFSVFAAGTVAFIGAVAEWAGKSWLLAAGAGVGSGGSADCYCWRARSITWTG
jgi:creatinine amidohydrolase